MRHGCQACAAVQTPEEALQARGECAKQLSCGPGMRLYIESCWVKFARAPSSWNDNAWMVQPMPFANMRWPEVEGPVHTQHIECYLS